MGEEAGRQPFLSLKGPEGWVRSQVSPRESVDAGGSR